jgi:hypothetical protein
MAALQANEGAVSFGRAALSELRKSLQALPVASPRRHGYRPQQSPGPKYR